MSGNLFRRGAVWWGRVQVRGRDIRRSLRTSNRATAKKRLKEWLDEMEHIAFHGDARHKWQDAVTRYTTDVLPGNVKRSTATRYLCSLRQVDPVLRGKFLDEIGPREIAKIAHRKGPSNATRRRDLTAVSAVLKAACAWGWIANNPALSYDRSVVKERRDPINPPSNADIAKLLARCPDNFRLAIKLLAETGMRQEEAFSLEWSQVDLKLGRIQLIQTKTNRPRVIELSKEAVGTIAGTARHLHSPYVFWHGKGQRYKNVSSRFRALARAAGVDFRCHNLRHRFAIQWLREGRDIYRLSRHLGHSSVKTTEIYLGYVGTNPGTEATVQSAQKGRGSTQAVEMAEGMGFEPTIRSYPYNGLANPGQAPADNPKKPRKP